MVEGAAVGAGPGGVDRIRSLDGLRGIASIAVVAHHCALTSPTIAAAYRGDPDVGWYAWIWTNTPLHLIWSGPVPVFLFFALSGYVLSLPGAVPPVWGRFWVKRFIRLYVPIWAGLVVAYALALAVPRTATPGQSWWMAVHAEPITAGSLVVDAVVVRGVSWIDSPLWSLRWEIFFSALLPVLLPLMRRLARWPAAVLAGLFAAVVLGRGLEAPWLVYLPMFFVGVVLAQRREEVQGWLERRTRGQWLAMLVVAFALMNAGWYGVDLRPVDDALGLLGAVLLILACLAPQAAGLGRCRPAVWLAYVSLGLYLVHEPLVVTAATLWPALPPPVLFVVVLPVALAVAWVMTVTVEYPSRRLAAWAARRTPALDPATRQALRNAVPARRRPSREGST